MAAVQRPHQYIYDQSGYIAKIKGFHQGNYDSVDQSLRHTHQQLKNSIASSSDSELTYTRLYSMLLSVWCEARLHILLYQNGVFEEPERALIYNSGSVENKWKKALHVAVIKKSGLTIRDQINEETVSFSLLNIYQKINGWIAEHFSPVIRSRNKIAHAQWVTPFTNSEDEWKDTSSFNVCEYSKRDFNAENLLTLELKIKLLSSIASAINNLAVDDNLYRVQNFDQLYTQMLKHENRLKSVDFSSFKSHVQQAYNQNKNNSISNVERGVSATNSGQGEESRSGTEGG